MTDDLDVSTRREDLTEGRAAGRERARRKRRRTLVVIASVLVLLAVVLGGGYYVVRDVFGVEDYSAPGEGDVVVRVFDGNSTSDIAAMLARRDVVRSAGAFTKAAGDDDRIRSVQPGYYKMRLRASGAAAVAQMLDGANRVGQLEIRGGVQLDDTKSPDGTVTPGVLSLLAKATCTDLDGRSTCISAEEFGRTMAATDPQLLGVPQWALADVRRALPARRLEGLLVPGRYNIQPGESATDALRDLVSASAARLDASGLVAGAPKTGLPPYQVLVLSSLVEKEGIAGDFGKIARVVYNRLAAGQRLELDSTVNYPLDLQAARTTPADRTKPGPYNSYVNVGLPPTPIGAPGNNAITSALTPTAGSWLFFVKCQKDGTSCFATTLPEHQANVAAAQAAGAY